MPTPLDPKKLRHTLRTLIRDQDHLHPREAPRHTRTVIDDIGQLVTWACTLLQEGERAQTLLILRTITDVLTTQWMYLNDIHGEVNNFFHEFAYVWTEVLLRVDLTARERKQWATQFAIWQARFTGLSIEAAFDAPQAAIREGWEYAPLQRVLQGTSPEQRALEGETPAYAAVLTRARLAVLEARGQVQEYLRLARAEGQICAYVTMLVRQGQITEALAYGYHHLTTAEDTLAVAQALVARGEHAASLQLATHGLTLEGPHVPLALWLRDHAWSQGEQNLALEAITVAFREEPTLTAYLHAGGIAGAQWPAYRNTLLDLARQAPWTADAQAVIRLFLHEHLFEDAIAVLKKDMRHTFVAQIVDAALEEQTALEWVIEACRQQAEHIMNGAKASYYQAAVTWLTKARMAYHLLGREEAWHSYHHALLERHRQKSKLVPLLLAL